MLKDIQSAIERVFADYGVSIHVDNECVDSPETLKALIASEVFKAVAVGQIKPPTKGRKKQQQPEQLPEGAAQIKVFA